MSEEAKIALGVVGTILAIIIGIGLFCAGIVAIPHLMAWLDLNLPPRPIFTEHKP